MKRLKRTLARCRRALFGPVPGATILLYHRVTRLASDPQWLCVTPEHFDEQLQFLRRHYTPMSLETLGHCLENGSTPLRAVVITFDDGYADNLLEARPILEKHGIPATVFITTGKTEAAGEFWWDELEALLLAPPKLPEKLELKLDGAARSWPMDKVSGNCNEPASARWNVAMDFDPTPRHEAYRELAPLIKELCPEQRERVMDQIATWAGVPRSARPTHRPLRVQEIVELAKGSLVEVGAHTVTHPWLSGQTAAEQKFEIEQSKRALEEILDRRVSSFSYPFGTQHDYGPQTVSLVKEAGFRSACSNFEGRVRAGADRLQLPRFLVRDWNGDAFEKQLEEWSLVDGHPHHPKPPA